MIPIYPVFAPLELSYKEEVEKALRGTATRVSEFNFAEMYIWRKPRQTEVSMLDNNLIVRLKRHEKTVFYRPFDSTPFPQPHIMQKLLADTPDTYIYGITEEELNRDMLQDKFAVSTDEGDSDYIYLREDLAELKGRKYDGKRNHLKKFYQNDNTSFEPITRDNISAVLEFQYDWCELRRCEDDMSLINEGAAAIELIENFETLSAFGMCAKIDGAIKGYSLAVKNSEDTAVVILEKADHTYQGIYQAINNIMNAEAFLGLTYVNREQDMGIEGLRKAKLSYHPVELLAKYMLRKK